METRVEQEISAAYQDQFPVLHLFFQQVADLQITIEKLPMAQGMEIRFLNQVNEMPNRARLRIFFPSQTKCLFFFHKKSVIPFSRDRYSYGGVVIDARSSGRFEEQDVREWIDYLRNGLPPKLRPATVKKSFPYTVPEDD